jgi:TRAP-type uncharacterized transport system substrate-binding protein
VREESLIVAEFVAVRMSSRSGVVVTAVAGTSFSSTFVIPIHPGALNYYREAGLVH